MTRRHVYRPRMPRMALYELSTRARTVSGALGDRDVIAELDGQSHILKLARTDDEGVLELTGRLRETPHGHVHEETNDPDAEFKLPYAGVRLRLFLRSPARQRVIAFSFGGYLSRRPGELETVTRAAALALNSILGLAEFRMLAGLGHVEVPVLGLPPVRLRPAVAPVLFTVPVLLLTGTGTPAAWGHVAGEIDLERVDPVNGRPVLRLSEDGRLEWDPVVAGRVRFESYGPVLTETVLDLISDSLGTGMMRDIVYDIMLGEPVRGVADLHAAVTGLPRLCATP
ncbi:hypothetical protein ACFQ07_19495, partial [Actinomadura adrarensis]